MLWDHAGSNFSDLGQKLVLFFLRTIQRCHLLMAERRNLPGHHQHQHTSTCATYRKKVPICPSNNPPQRFTGLCGARASERVGASWLSDIDAGAKVYLSARRSRSCWCLATCLRAHGSSVYKHDPRTLTGSYERASECRIPRTRVT